MSGATGECPSEDELMRMVEGALDDASLVSIERHVDRCEACAEVIAGLGALGRSRGPGERRAVGRYQLDRRIAAGGMGEVWAAWDPQLRREIAVKLVKPERADDGKERDRLLREARALARLGHPNVLAVYDVGELDGEVFIATELVAGETLASRGGPSASWRELVRLYTQAARGLAAAHAAGLVHRDVKPSNLLLGADGRVRVADFGLAVRSSMVSPTTATGHATDEVSITASGFVSGTPAYMAPEQRAGQPPDARADQYALCVSLVEAIDGRRPAAGVDRDALIAFVSERRARETELDALCGVLARGLAVDPRRRFPDTDSFADALERTLTSRDIESAATVSAAEIPPALGSGRYGGSGPKSEPESQPTKLARGSRSSTGPQANRGPGSDAGPRGGRAREGSAREGSAREGSHRSDSAREGSAREGSAREGSAREGSHRSDSHRSDSAREGSHRTNPGVRSIPRSSPGPGSRPRPAPPSRRAAPIIIAGLAAAAGVAAVLIGARALSKKPARPSGGAGDPALEVPAPAMQPPEVHVEPLEPGPGSGSAKEPATAPTTGNGPGQPPARPAGAPLDLPRAPANKAVAAAPPAATAPFADLSPYTADLMKHLRQRDARACKRTIASLPSNMPATARHTYDSFAAYCDMMGGDCAGGKTKLIQAMTAQGLPPQPDALAEQYCPIEGPLETRLARIRTQTAAHTMGPMDLAWCDALIAPAKQAAGEVGTGPQRGVLGWAIRQLAKCVGTAGRCDEARSLWTLANTVDESGKFQQPDLGAACAAAGAALSTTETYADATPLLQSLSAAIRQHDVRGCQKLIAAPIPNVPPASKHSIELLIGQCEMVSGDCAAGTARLSRIGPNTSRTVSAATAKAWLNSNVSTYCPITGDLDARVARLWSQIDGFTTRDSGNIAWCDVLIPAAKTIAGEVATAAHRERTGASLRRLAACVGRVGRCDQGRDLWELAAQVDPSTPSTPALGDKCP